MPTQSMKCAAIIPAYNEASTIGVIASGTLRHVDQVIIVDDGSEDGSLDLAKVLANRYTNVRVVARVAFFFGCASCLD